MTEVTGRRRILVTGGSHGIGAGICQAFAQLGDTVAVHCRASRDAAKALVASLPGSGHEHATARLALLSDATRFGRRDGHDVGRAGGLSPEHRG